MLQADLEEACRYQLVAVQQQLARTSREIYVCPAASLHVTVAILLHVRRGYSTTKDELWRHYGEAWCRGLGELATALEPFVINFEALVVNSDAVIALAPPVPAIEQFRQRANELLAESGLESFQPSIVHCTLLHFSQTGLDLTPMTHAAKAVALEASSSIAEVTVAQESIYPSLVRRRIARLVLGRRPTESTRRS